MNLMLWLKTLEQVFHNEKIICLLRHIKSTVFIFYTSFRARIPVKKEKKAFTIILFLNRTGLFSKQVCVALFSYVC